MANLDFCCGCGSWVSADSGKIRNSSNGDVEIICFECSALENGRAVPIGPDRYNGSLDSDVGGLT